MNDINSAFIHLKLTDITSSNRREVSLDSAEQKVRIGQNFVQVDLRDYNGMVRNHIYLLEVLNARQEKRYLKFEFRKDNN